MAPSIRVAPPLIARVPEDDPRCAGWLVWEGPEANCTPEGYELVLRGTCDDGLWEEPWGSNESPRINRYTKRGGYTPPQYWCGLWLGACYIDRGMFVPEWYGSVDWWLPYSQPVTLEFLKAKIIQGGDYAKRLPGAAIIYGKKGSLPLQMPDGQGYHPDVLKKSGWDGIHIEMITRAEVNKGAQDGAAILTRGGNRSYGMTHNTGVSVNQYPTERHDVIAIHFPKRIPGYTPRKQTIRLVPA